MEIDEVAARILRRYWRLLLVTVLVPVALVGFYYVGRPPTYTSQARLVASDTLPTSTAEADAVVSETRALATSRNVLADAISDAHADRQPDAVLPQVSVSGLGTSPIVELAVSDRDADTARQLAQALADRVVQQLGTSRVGSVDTVLKNIDNQLTQLASRRAPLAAAAAAAPHDPVAQNRLAGIDRLISDLSADRNKVSLDAAAIGQPRVVQPAQQPPAADSAGLVPRLGLAGLLGLVVGVAIAAWAETIRPTVPGASRVARLLDAPLLGTLTGGSVAAADVGRRVRLAAARAGVRTVVLIGTGRRPLPPGVVAAIAAAALTDGDGAALDPPDPAGAGSAPAGEDSVPEAVDGRPRDNGVAAHRPTGRPLAARSADTLTTPAPVAADGAPAALPSGRSTLDRAGRVELRRVCGFGDLAPGAESSRETGPVGLVVVAPPVNRLSAVRAVRDLMTISAWPLLGVLAERKGGGGARS